MHADPKDSAPPLAVVGLWAGDVSQAAHFYSDVIGLTLAAHHGERTHFDLGGTNLTILRGAPHPAEYAVPARFPVMAFRLPHLEPAIVRLAAAGVPLPWGIEEEGDSRWVMFHDPAGNLVELVEFD